MSITDLFKPKWKHSDPKIRAAEVKSLGAMNQPILSAIVRSDSSAEVRKIAVRKIENPEVLEAVVARDQDTEVRKIAKAKLNEQASKELKKNENPENLDILLSRLDDERLREDLLRSAKSTEVRRRLLPDVQKETVLAKVACKDKDGDIALEAAKRIAGQRNLERIRRESTHREVRKLVAQKLNELNNHKRLADEKRLDKGKRNTLLSALQNLSDSPTSSREELDKLNTAWTEVRDGAQKSEEELFDCLTETVKNTLNEREEEARKLAESREKNRSENEAQAARERLQRISQDRANRERSAAEELEHRHDLVAQLEHLSESANLSGIQGQLSALQKMWKPVDALDNNEEPAKLEQEFLSGVAALTDRIEKERTRVEEEQKEVLNKLETLCQSIEELDENQDFGTISKALSQGYRDWKEISSHGTGRYQDLWQRFQEATAKFKEMQKWESWHNEKGREELIRNAQKLLEFENGEEIFSEVRKLQKEWKESGHVERSRSQELWETFRDICDRAVEKARPWLEKRDEERKVNLETKTALCERAEAIAEGEVENWREATNQIKALQEEWKEAGPVPRENNRSIWARFRKACDTFFNRLREFHGEEDGRRGENLQKKEQLCAKAEELSESTEWGQTSRQLQSLQADWKKIGPVPRTDSEHIWKRFRTACDTFFDHKKEHFRKKDDERLANLEQKVALCEKLESMSPDPNNTEDIKAFDDAEKQWKKIGPVPKDKSDAIWERFCSVCDAFFDKRLAGDEKLKKKAQENLERKEEILERTGEIVEQDSWVATSEELKGLQDRWKSLGRVGSADAKLWKTFRELCDEFFDRRQDHYDILDQTRVNNLHKKEILTEQAERLAAREEPGAAEMEEVRLMRKNWKDIGPVPRRDSDKIWDRFNKACDGVFEKARGGSHRED